MLEIVDNANVRELRINRPPVNALDPTLVAALAKALDEAVAADAGAIVLSGAPNMFSAGLDVRALLKLDASGIRDFWRAFFGLMERIARSPIPVVSAITGHCPAGGAVLVMFGDYRVMATGPFKIGLNEVSVGLFPGRLILSGYARLVGHYRAGELMTRGALLDPETAKTYNLVDELQPQADVIPRAHAYAAELLKLPSKVFKQTRDLTRADLGSLFDTLDEAFYQQAADNWLSEETQNTMRSLFVKK